MRSTLPVWYQVSSRQRRNAGATESTRVFLNASNLNKALMLQTYIARAPLVEGSRSGAKINS